MFDYVLNFQLVSALLTASVALFLGYLVYNHNRGSRLPSDNVFIAMAGVFTVWVAVNYVSVNAAPAEALYWIRMVLAFAVVQLALFLIFVDNFNQTKLILARPLVFLYLPLALAGIVLIFTDYVFKAVEIIGDSIVPVPGPLVSLFVVILAFLFVSTLVEIYRKYRTSVGQIRKQWFAISLGFFAAFTLLFFLVFGQVVLFQYTAMVAYSPLFILPIFIGSAIAIMRHGLFNIKILATEALVFALLLVSFTQVLVSDNPAALVVSVFVVFFILIAGAQLIRSVMNEVKQREELQALTSQLAQANEQLQALDKVRAEFISIASHQLRTPPATIKWYLAAVLGGDYGRIPPKARQALTKAQTTNNGQIALIDDMLNVSRIERGKMEFLFEETDLARMTGEVVDQLMPQAQEKKLKLVYKKPRKALPLIALDHEKFSQVINNLIDNAIKYSKTGTISVALSADAKAARLAVTDSGKGMSADDLARAFTKYGRGSSAQEHSSGLGLGLYVSKVIVEHHKGRIWAESKGLGRGSTFVVTLPLRSGLKDEIVDFTKPQP